MFGYVRPPLEELPPEDVERFRRIYCGLCHTLGRRFGPAARFILNYDFTFLAILLSEREDTGCGQARCVASPVRKKCYQRETDALELAADESVILAYWQLRDGALDHGFWKSLKYRFFALLLHGAYRKAARLRPEFDAGTRRQLDKLSQLERERSSSMDKAADTFAQLLAGAAEEIPEETKRRVLRQILYHLGRWIYLIDAADDLKKDAEEGNYNPLIFRYGLSDAVLDLGSRGEFTETIDHSIHLIATAYELWDFGCWSKILESTVYSGLFRVGKAVLDGTFETSFLGKKERKSKNVEETT